MNGKLKGGTYKVFISPEGQKIYTANKAIAAGFKADGECDGRKKRQKKKNA